MLQSSMQVFKQDVIYRVLDCMTDELKDRFSDEAGKFYYDWYSSQEFGSGIAIDTAGLRTNTHVTRARNRRH